MKGRPHNRRWLEVLFLASAAAALTLLWLFLISPLILNTAAAQEDDGTRDAQTLTRCGGTLTYGRSRADRIQSPAGVCRYEFNAQAGDIVTIAMNRLTGDLDPYLELRGLDGTFVNDDDGNGGRDSLIAGYRLTRGGRYDIIARSWDSACSGDFVITVTRLTASTCGGAMLVGSTVTGHLTAGRKCWYQFHGQQGQVITIAMNRRNDALDPFLRLIDPNRVEVQAHDDVGGDVNALIAGYRLNQNGVWTIAAGSYNDETGGAFILSLR